MARKLYTNVFGVIEYNEDTFENKFKYSGTDKDDPEERTNMNINDLITRETKLGKSLHKTARAIEAINNAPEYLQKKYEDLELIKNKLILKYKELYPSYLDRYQDPELAYKRTMSEVKRHKEQLMSDHLYYFPTQIAGDRNLPAVTTKTETK